MRWFEQKIIAPLDRGILKIENWLKGSSNDTRMLIVFFAFIAAVVLIEVFK